MNKRAKQKIGIRHLKINTLWDLDHYLANHIHSALLQFKHMERNSYPGQEGANTLEEWEEVLDKMIWSFDQSARDYPGDPFGLAWDEYYKKHPEELHQPLFEKEEDKDGYTKLAYKSGFEYTSTVKEERIIYENRVQEGLDLFAKFFSALWD